MIDEWPEVVPEVRGGSLWLGPACATRAFTPSVIRTGAAATELMMRRRRPIRSATSLSPLFDAGAATPFGVPASPESPWLPFIPSTPAVKPLRMAQSYSLESLVEARARVESINARPKQFASQN